ncbi:hypothetical protein ABIE44_003529 [Marmoricola sp. OAE513]
MLAVDGARLTALPLRSRTDQQRRNQVWMDLGAGAWDRQDRSSEVQLNRVLTVSIYDVRRNGAELDAALFDEVLRASRRYR